MDLIRLYRAVECPVHVSGSYGTGAAFKGDPIAVLSGFISAKVKEELNGSYIFEGEYSSDAPYADQLKANAYEGERLIECYTTTKRGSGIHPQLFRITSVKKTTSSKISVTAEHISYDMAKYLVVPMAVQYNVTTGDPIRMRFSDLIDWIEAGHVYGYPYEEDVGERTLPFMFEKVGNYGNEAKDVNFTALLSLRQWIGDSEYGILKTFGGEVSFDNERVIFQDKRGTNNPYKLLYGKNIKSYTHKIDGTGICGALLPYYKKTLSDGTGRNAEWGFEESEYLDEHGDPVYPILDPDPQHPWGYLDGYTIDAPFISVEIGGQQVAINKSKALAADLTSEIDYNIREHHEKDGWEPSSWDDIIVTQDDLSDSKKQIRETKRQWRNRFLAEATDKYMKEHLFEETTDITIDFQSLYSPENLYAAEELSLGDTVYASYAPGGWSCSKRITSITYDVLKCRYDKIELKSSNKDAATTIAETALTANSASETGVSKSSSFESDVKKIIDSYGTGAISGSGTENNLVKWTGTSSIGNSGITIDSENRVTFPGALTANPNPSQNSSISNYILGIRTIKQDITSNNVSNKYVTMLPYNVDHSYIGNSSYPWERGYFTNIVSGLPQTTWFSGDSVACWDGNGYLKKRTIASVKNEIIPPADSSTRNKVLKHVYDETTDPETDEVEWAEDKDTTYTLGTYGNRVTLTPSQGPNQYITVPYSTKALNDAGGSQIDTYYAHGLNISGHTISLTDGNDEEISGSSVTIPDVSWNDITGKPGTFPPSSHTHSASDITSGTFSPSRIPVGTGLNTANHAINVIEPVPPREGSSTGGKILMHDYYEDPDDPDSNVDELKWTDTVDTLSSSNVSTLINKLSTASASAAATNYLVAQDNGGGNTYYRRSVANVVKGVLGYSQSGSKFPVELSSGNKLYVNVPSATANPLKVGSTDVTSGNTVTFVPGNGMSISLQQSSSGSRIIFDCTSVPCVIEGTPIRLSNGVDIPVEELQNGDEILSWDPNTEQFTTAVVCVVRNTGKDKEFVDHIFDDGSHLTTYGEHVVYNKTKGYPMDISKFEPGDETVSVTGDTIVYCGSMRHYCRERRMAHYDISSSNNLYFAGGILNGKMQFAKFRAMDDMNMELTPAVQAVFDIHKAENAKDLGYENNDEYYKQIAAEFKQQMSLKKKIADAKQKLADSDYLVQKFTENLLTLTEWAKAKTNRASWRTIINDSEALLKPIEERINAIKSKFATRRNNKRTRFNQQCRIDNEHFADYKAMFKKGETDEK
jgi:hypothetical protein